MPLRFRARREARPNRVRVADKKPSTRSIVGWARVVRATFAHNDEEITTDGSRRRIDVDVEKFLTTQPLNETASEFIQLGKTRVVEVRPKVLDAFFEGWLEIWIALFILRDSVLTQRTNVGLGVGLEVQRNLGSACRAYRQDQEPDRPASATITRIVHGPYWP
jgi:hypothetical protein